MTSLKQIEANQKNVLKSTGPLSEQGRSVVSRNAVKHGILSTRVYCEDEERELYEDFFRTMIRNLNPQGSFESFLSEKIISTAWRLRRVLQVETLMFQEAKNSLFGDSLCEVFKGNSVTSMATLSRYERSLEAALYRAIKELKAAQEQGEVEIFGARIGPR